MLIEFSERVNKNLHILMRVSAKGFRQNKKIPHLGILI